jgi:hypothetical protein
MRERLTKDRVTEILRSFYLHNFIAKPQREIFSESVIRSDVQVNGVDSPGLGDSLILTSVLPKVRLFNEPLKVFVGLGLLKENDFSQEEAMTMPEIARFDWGGGHCTQRLQRAFGLEPSLRPQARLTIPNRAIERGRVFVHLKNDTDMKRCVPNSLDEHSINTVKIFFSRNPDLKPIYFGNDLSLTEMVGEMETCEFFLGIDSGPMHLAAALNLKSIVIINSPSTKIHLPCLRESLVPNSEWLYPQNTHLNRAGENELVPRFNFENLKSAFAGEIYQYWSEEFLDIKMND